MKNRYPTAIAILFLAAAAAANATEVTRFTPQHEAKRVRQVTIDFSEPVRPLGDLTGPAPVTWVCRGSDVVGRARWVDTHSWAVDFDRELPAGVDCEFKSVAGFEDAAGKPVKMEPSYRFNTGGPNIASIYAGRDWTGIDENAVFLVTATGPVDFSTVAPNTWCGIEGVGEKVPVTVLPDSAKMALLKEHGNLGMADRTVALRCARALPNGMKVLLNWGKGIKSTSGYATSALETKTFKVRPEFSVTVSCERENSQSDCVPLTPILLRFTASVRRADVVKLRLIGPGGKSWKATVADDDGDSEFVDYVQFIGPFPTLAQFHLQVPPQIRDDANRPLTNRDRLAKVDIKTSAYPPMVKFAADFGVIERNAGGLLPATVRNLEPPPADAAAGATADDSKPGTAARLRILRLTSDEDILGWFSRIAEFNSTENSRGLSLLTSEPQARTTLLPKPNGPKPMEVVGIPLKDPGYYVVEAESRILGEHLLESDGPMYVHTEAVNTNLSVHFKNGEENQLVWVTALDTGKPVANARIAIRTCDGKQVAFGTTGADGTTGVRRRLPPNTHCMRGLWNYFVSARAIQNGVEDMGFVLSGWQKGIETWRFKLPYAGAVPDVITHTIFDRPLFRAGETVHMKHVARRHTTAGFAYVPAAQLPEKIVIQLEDSDTKYEMPLSWKNGVAESTWTIPPAAKLGRYIVNFARAKENLPRASAGGDDDSDGDNEWTPSGRFWQGGSFKVAEFRLPVLKGEMIGSAPIVAGSELNVDLKLAYLAGGAAGLEKVRVRSEMRPAAIKPPLQFEDFNFASAPLDPKKLASPDWNSSKPEPEIFDDQREVVLEKTGTRRLRIKQVPQWTVPASVYTEMEYSDPSGEVHTAAGNSAWFPASVVAGISAEEWASATDKVEVKLAALDSNLKPLANAPFAVHAWLRKAVVHRKRMIGGFYSYDTHYQSVDLGEVCKAQSDDKGAASCEFKPPKDDKNRDGGEIVLEAKARDAEGRASFAQTTVWLAGNNEMWFEQDESDRIDVIPEKRRYEPGDTAVFQVRMPFREATALVSVEREGVIDRFVTALSGSKPTVSVPIKANYGPNVFVSVLVVRGRLGEVQPTALVDLGRPAYKLGVAEITVGQKGYELTVNVSTDKPVYLAREQAVAKIHVSKPDGTPAKGGEFALAAVDEALLELSRNDSWDLLARMMTRRGYAIQTSTAQTQVIGKRHFGLKALPAGGGGGRQPTRELFDTLIKWQGSVALDDNGDATVKLPLNDSLTSIRVVAIAQQGSSLFGTGFARIRSTKDVQLFSGLPPLVRDTDKFRAGLTIRNLSPRKDSFTVTPNAAAMVNGATMPIAGLSAQSVVLEPGEAKELGWPVTVPIDASRIDWRAEARAAQGGSDAIKLSQNVVTSLPVRVQASTLEQLDGSLAVPVKLVAGAEPGRGGVDVFLKSKLGASTDSVRQYMEAYPYVCLEQQVSKAISTGNRARWEQSMSRLPTYLDNDGLAWYFPNPRAGWGSVVLTSYVLATANEGGYEIPEAAQAQMLAGLAGYVEGRVKRNDLDTWSHKPDLPTRKLLAIDALSRYGRATVQQVSTVAITPGLWPTASVVDWLNILQRMKDIPDRDHHIAEAEAILRTRMVASGTLTQFNNEADDYWWWLMMSPDETAARAISALMDANGWQRDIPRLVRGVMSRQKEGHWNTTPANTWGVLMLDKFSRKFEADPVTGFSKIALTGSATPAQSADWEKIYGMQPARDAAVAAGQAPVPVPGTAWRDPGEAFHFAWPASGSGEVNLRQEGSGKPWVTVQARAARRLSTPFYAGFEVKKTVTPVEQKVAGQWNKGDVARVQLVINAPSEWTWVVINDPVPAGSTILGSGLGGDSQLANKPSKAGLDSTPSFIERAFEGYRAYFEFLPKGTVTVEYSYRVNNTGDFKLPPTRVEAMYAPENFGEFPNPDWKVE